MDNQPAVLILDASTLLNIYATGRLRDIASAASYRFAVAEYVLREEALFVWQCETDDDVPARVPLDLDPLIEDGSIELMTLHAGEEVETFVNFALSIDDGEAITAALALHRGCAVATDDRKARRVIAARAPLVPLVSTLDLLSEWAETAQLATKEVREVMEAMRSGASYVPGRRDPRFEWWLTIMQEDG